MVYKALRDLGLASSLTTSPAAFSLPQFAPDELVSCSLNPAGCFQLAVAIPCACKALPAQHLQG